jgi:hypothetical protein
MIDKVTFRENMGLLGLESGSFLADRIFQVIDTDRDGYVNLILEIVIENRLISMTIFPTLTFSSMVTRMKSME